MAYIISEYINRFIDFAERQGADKEYLLQHLNCVELLEDDDNLLPIEILFEVIDRAYPSQDLAGVGYQFGLELDKDSHGFLGFAMSSCITFRDALITMNQYMLTRNSSFHIDLSEGNQEARLNLQLMVDTPRHVQFLLEATIGMGITFLDQMLNGQSLPIPLNIKLTIPEQEGWVEAGTNSEERLWNRTRQHSRDLYKGPRYGSLFAHL